MLQLYLSPRSLLQPPLCPRFGPWRLPAHPLQIAVRGRLVPLPPTPEHTSSWRVSTCRLCRLGFLVALLSRESPTPLTSSVLSLGARYKPHFAHSLGAAPRRAVRQPARSYRRCSPFCAFSSRAARGLGLDPTLGSFRLLSILLRRRRLRHCRFHCSVRALPSDSPLATPPCALAWGPPLSGNRRLDGLTGQA